MSRSVKKMMEDFFTLLTKHTTINLQDYKSIRLFVTEYEFTAINSGIIHLVSVNFGYGHIASLYFYQNNTYMILPACYDGNEREGLQASDIPNELWLYHIVRNKIVPLEKANDNELLMNVFTEVDVTDVSFESVINYFPCMIGYIVDDVVPDDVTMKESYIRQLCLEMLCKSSSLLSLPFDNDTINAYLGIANTDNVNIPIDNVLRSIISYRWKFCFIDLYRCHERLFMLAWVDEFKSSMQSTLGLKELYKNMKSVYSTEHHEDKNIASLYNLLPDNILDVLKDEERGNAEKIAKYIYTLRNTIVHYQRTEAIIDQMSDVQWNKIIQFLLMAIPYLYDHLAIHIEELPDV